jgi:predicted amidohydrolase YtcJ
MPLRQLYDSGANITLSSDWNVNPLSPLAGIANAIKLKDNGLPNLEAAIDAYTINASKALGLTHITGSIEVGKSADIVVLDRNIKKQVKLLMQK